MNRRTFLSGAALLAGGLSLPRRARPATAVPEQKFLFFFCEGGWHPARVFAPLLNPATVDVEAGAVQAEIGGITFVDHPERPSVRALLEEFAPRTCFVNGFEVRSIAHERCQRLLLTGRGDSGVDDWAAILAAHSANDLLMPHLVLSGPAFSSVYTSSVVRMGSERQLVSLLDGTLYLSSDQAVGLPSPQAQSLTDAYVRARVTEASAAAGRGAAARFATSYGAMLDRVGRAGEVGAALTGGGEGGSTCGGVWDQVAVAVDALEQGLSRCVMIGYQGQCAATFDTHTDDQRQSVHLEEAFQHVLWALRELDARPGAGGGSLLDETTLVMCSEMGRHPKLNTMNGRDHWTFTSTMLVGGGIRGGQVVGGYDDYGMGRPADLASGAPTDGGTTLLASHLGATLLALGGLDPGEFVYDGSEIGAVIA